MSDTATSDPTRTIYIKLYKEGSTTGRSRVRPFGVQVPSPHNVDALAQAVWIRASLVRECRDYEIMVYPAGTQVMTSPVRFPDAEPLSGGANLPEDTQSDPLIVLAPPTQRTNEQATGKQSSMTQSCKPQEHQKSWVEHNNFMSRKKVDKDLVEKLRRESLADYVRHVAMKEEVEVWINHCKKPGCLQSLRDKREINKPSNGLNLLYYCPRQGKDCLVNDLAGYTCLLARLRDPPYHFLKGKCGCGNPASNFKPFLPRKTYIEKYGHSDDSRDHLTGHPKEE